MKHSSRPTIYDVARDAGVSHMTVCRSINESGKVSEKTRLKVEKSIKKLGYRPDPVLSALAAYRSQGYVTDRGSGLAFIDCDDSQYSQQVFSGVQAESTNWGYSVEKFPFQPQEWRQQKLARMLFHRGVRGLLFGPSNQACHFKGWNWDEFAAVSLGALTHEPRLNCVAMDYFHGSYVAYKHLEQHGCRKIGLIVESRLEQRTDYRWRGGYCAGLDNLRKALIYPEPALTRNSVKNWLVQNKIDGILTIHRFVWEITQPLNIKAVFLNDFEPVPDVRRLTLDPSLIGKEGVRSLHHLLLKREYGISNEPRMIALRATLK